MLRGSDGVVGRFLVQVPGRGKKQRRKKKVYLLKKTWRHTANIKSHLLIFLQKKVTMVKISLSRFFLFFLFSFFCICSSMCLCYLWV